MCGNVLGEGIGGIKQREEKLDLGDFLLECSCLIQQFSLPTLSQLPGNICFGWRKGPYRPHPIHFLQPLRASTRGQKQVEDRKNKEKN